MTILFVGDGSYDMYSKAFYAAACKLEGVFADLLEYEDMNIKAISHKNYLKRAEYHFCLGPDVDKINNELIKRYENNRYDIVFLYSAELIYPNTVRKLKDKGAYIGIYHNDNPFSEGAKKYRYRHFVKTIKYSDISYSYRDSNICDYRERGAKKVKLLRSYYIDDRNYYIDDLSIDMDVPDVCFVGHFEDDGRKDYIQTLLNNSVKVGLPEDWKEHGVIGENIVYLNNPHKNYNAILNKTKIAIVFLSSLNKDTYTRRCFEIPAVKTMMIAPYTNDIATLYDDSKEVVLFHDKTDFVDKIKYYLSHEDERLEIANAGYRRLMRDGHEAKDRVREIISDWKERDK